MSVTVRPSLPGVSIGWPAILLVGFILWLGYGIALGDPPLMITNTVAALVCVVTLAVLVWFRPRQRTAGRQPGIRL